MGKTWAVCSGNGGVGKSTIALSLAVGAAKAGKKTILLDVSGAARSCDLILGLESVVVLDMVDVIRGQIHIESALYPAPQYKNLLFACASLYNDVPVSEITSMTLALHSLCDVLVVDLPTGLTDLGRGMLREGDERLIVLRPDDASIRSAERILMHCREDLAASSLVINRVSRERLKRRIQYSQDVVQNLLDCLVTACIPEDASIAKSEQRGRAAIECDGPAWTALSNLVKTLLGGA